MNIQDYKFNVGDIVITTEGETGVITNICDCSSCARRGFFEPFWSTRGVKWDKGISIYDAEAGFVGYYKIGNYRFNDLDKAAVLREMASYEDALKQLKKQLQTIDELEGNS